MKFDYSSLYMYTQQRKRMLEEFGHIRIEANKSIVVPR